MRARQSRAEAWREEGRRRTPTHGRREPVTSPRRSATAEAASAVTGQGPRRPPPPPHLGRHSLDVGGDDALEGVGVLLSGVDDGLRPLLSEELVSRNNICGDRPSPEGGSRRRWADVLSTLPSHRGWTQLQARARSWPRVHNPPPTAGGSRGRGCGSSGSASTAVSEHSLCFPAVSSTG